MERNPLQPSSELISVAQSLSSLNNTHVVGLTPVQRKKGGAQTSAEAQLMLVYGACVGAE